MGFTKKNSKSADDRRKFGKGKMDVMKVGGFTFGLSTMPAGWKWSKDVKPIIKTDLCQGHHVGYVVAGSLAGVMHDGSKWRISSGDVFDIPAGHDAWTIGRKSVVLVDFIGAADFAKK